MDRDGDGFLSAAELRKALKKLGVKHVTQDDADDAIELALISAG